jgi:hypothetical protein
VISRFPLDIEQRQFSPTDQFQCGSAALGTDEGEILDFEERAAIRAFGDDRYVFYFQHSSARDAVLADEIEAKGERLGHHCGQFTHLKPNGFDLLQPMTPAFFQDDFENALSNGHFVHEVFLKLQRLNAQAYSDL